MKAAAGTPWKPIHNIVITASSSSYFVLKRFTAVIIYPLKGYAGDKLYSVTYTPTYIHYHTYRYPPNMVYLILDLNASSLSQKSFVAP